MKAVKIDFKEIAVVAGGHAAGAALFTQVNKLKPMRAYDDPSKQAIKGAIVAGLGYVAIPYLANMLNLAGKGSQATFVKAAGHGMGLVGTMILANAVVKPAPGKTAIFPNISGVEGMGGENELSGLGMLYDENIEGYENDPTDVSGYETNPMLAGELDEVV